LQVVDVYDQIQVVMRPRLSPDRDVDAQPPETQ